MPSFDRNGFIGKSEMRLTPEEAERCVGGQAKLDALNKSNNTKANHLTKGAGLVLLYNDSTMVKDKKNYLVIGTPKQLADLRRRLDQGDLNLTKLHLTEERSRRLEKMKMVQRQNLARLRSKT